MHQPYETVYLESLLPVSRKTATSRSGSKTHNYACKLPSTCCKNTCTTKQAWYLYVYTFFLVTKLKYRHCSLLQVQCLCFNKQPVQFSLRSRQHICCNCRSLDPNPIDRFRIFVESLSIWVTYLFWKELPHSLQLWLELSCPTDISFTYVGRLITPEN